MTLEQSNDFKNVIVDSTGTVQYVSQQQQATIHVRCKLHINLQYTQVFRSGLRFEIS